MHPKDTVAWREKTLSPFILFMMANRQGCVPFVVNCVGLGGDGRPDQ